MRFITFETLGTGVRAGAQRTREDGLSSTRPELLATGHERGSNEHEKGQTEDDFAYE